MGAYRIFFGLIFLFRASTFLTQHGSRQTTQTPRCKILCKLVWGSGYEYFLWAVCVCGLLHTMFQVEARNSLMLRGKEGMDGRIMRERTRTEVNP